MMRFWDGSGISWTTRPCNVPRHVTARYKKSSFYYYYYYYYYVNNLHLASDRQPHQHLISQLLQDAIATESETQAALGGRVMYIW